MKLEAGQFVDVSIEQLGVNVRSILREPDGTIITEADSHRGARGVEMACLIAETADKYRLEIRSMRPLAVAGKYRVSVTAPRPATPQDQMRLAAQKLYAEGDLYRQKPDRDSWTKARKLYQQALKHWITIGDQPRQAVTLRQISALSGQLRLGREMLDEGVEALELYRALQDRSGEAHTLFTMAEGLSWALGDKDGALELYEQSLRICRELGERLIEGLVLQKFAILSRLRGEKEKALDYAQQSVALLQAAGERGDATVSFNELRAICQSLDDKTASENNLSIPVEMAACRCCFATQSAQVIFRRFLSLKPSLLLIKSGCSAGGTANTRWRRRRSLKSVGFIKRAGKLKRGWIITTKHWRFFARSRTATAKRAR